jgi:hypothetical protein
MYIEGKDILLMAIIWYIDVNMIKGVDDFQLRWINRHIQM